jgi:hypothetical protein
MGQAPSVSYPTSLAPGRRHSRIAAGFRYAPELPVNPVFHPTLLIVKERAASAVEMNITHRVIKIKHVMCVFSVNLDSPLIWMEIYFQ